MNIFADKRNYLEINGWPLCVCVYVCVCVCVCVFVTSTHGLYCAYYAMTWNLVNINFLNCVSHPGVELCLIGYPWPVYSWPLHIHYTRTHTAGHRQLASRQIAICKHDSPKVDILVIFIIVISSLFTKFFVKPDITIL